MKKEDGITRITLIIIVAIILIVIFMFLGKETKFEKTENKVADKINTQFRTIEYVDNKNVVVEKENTNNEMEQPSLKISEDALKEILIEQ